MALSLDEFLDGLLKNVTTGGGRNQLPQAQVRVPPQTAYGGGTPDYFSHLREPPREPIPVANPRREALGPSSGSSVEPPAEQPMPNDVPEPFKPVDTGLQTQYGRRVYEDPAGERYSEKTVTVPYGKDWAVAPTVDAFGNILSEDDVAEQLRTNGLVDPVTGEKLRTFKTVNDANRYAQSRSKGMQFAPAEAQADPLRDKIGAIQEQIRNTPEDAPNRWALLEGLAGYKAAYYQQRAIVAANNGNMEEAKRWSDLAPKPSVADIRDVEGPIDFMKYGYYYLGNMLPEAVGTAAVGLGGSAVGTPATGLAAFTAASAYQHRGRNLLAQFEAGEDRNGTAATAAAIAQGLVDRIGLGGTATGVMRLLTERIGGALVSKNLALRIGKEAGKGALGEGAAEAFQQVAQELQISKDRAGRLLNPQTPEDDKLLDQFVDDVVSSLVNGAVLGGVVGGGAGVFHGRPARAPGGTAGDSPDERADATLVPPPVDGAPDVTAEDISRADEAELLADIEAIPVREISYPPGEGAGVEGGTTVTSDVNAPDVDPNTRTDVDEFTRRATGPRDFEQGAPRNVASDNVRYSLGPKRPNVPSPEIASLVERAAISVLGPGATVEIYSGRENPGERHGSHRHGTGLAADLRVYDGDGNLVKIGTPEHAALARAFAASGAYGMGFGSDYMGDGFHIDLVGSQRMNGGQGGNIWGSGALAMQDELLPILQRNQTQMGGQYGPSLASSIRASARQLGIDPFVLATVISYETGGTFDPRQPNFDNNGHMGLIQWSPDNLKSYNVNLDDVGEQMKAVTLYLHDRGVRPGMGLLEVYAAINGGNVDAIHASDAANGGRPGDVSWKVANDMDAHMEKARALLGGQDAEVPPGSFEPNQPNGPRDPSQRPGDAPLEPDEVQQVIDEAIKEQQRSVRGEPSPQATQDTAQPITAQYSRPVQARVNIPQPETAVPPPPDVGGLNNPEPQRAAPQQASQAFDYNAYTAQQENARRTTGRDTIGAPRGAEPATLPQARPGRTVVQRAEDLSASLSPGQQQRVIREKLIDSRAGSSFNTALNNTFDAAMQVAQQELDRLSSQDRTNVSPAQAAKLNENKANVRQIIDRLKAAQQAVTALGSPQGQNVSPQADIEASQVIHAALTDLPSGQPGLAPVRTLMNAANRLIRVAPLQGSTRARPYRAVKREFQRLDSAMRNKAIANLITNQRQIVQDAAAQIQRPDEPAANPPPVETPTNVEEVTPREAHIQQTMGMIGVNSIPWNPTGVENFTYTLVYGMPPNPPPPPRGGGGGSQPPSWVPKGIFAPSGSPQYGNALSQFSTRNFSVELIPPKWREQFFDVLFRTYKGRGAQHAIRVFYAEGNSLRTRWRNIMLRVADKADKMLSDPLDRKRVDTLMLRTAFVNANMFDPQTNDLVDPTTPRWLQINPKRVAPTQAHLKLYQDLQLEKPEVIEAMGTLFSGYRSLSGNLVLQTINAELESLGLPVARNIDTLSQHLQRPQIVAALDENMRETMQDMVAVAQSGNYVPASRTGNYFVNATQVLDPITAADENTVRSLYARAQDADPSVRQRGGGDVKPVQDPRTGQWMIEVEVPFTAAFDTRRQAEAMQAELRRHMRLGTALPDVEQGAPFIPHEVSAVMKAADKPLRANITAETDASIQRLARGDNSLRNALMELNIRRSVRTTIANRENVLGGSYDAIKRAQMSGHYYGLQLANARTRGKISQVIANMEEDVINTENDATRAVMAGKDRLADTLTTRGIVMKQLVDYIKNEAIAEGTPESSPGKLFHEVANNAGQVARWMQLNSIAYAITNAHQPLVNGLGEMAGVYGFRGSAVYGAQLARSYKELGFAIAKFRARRGFAEQNTLWGFKEYIEDAEFIRRADFDALVQGVALNYSDIASPTQFSVDANGDPDGVYLSEADVDLLQAGKMSAWEAEVLSRGYRDGSVGAKIADVLDETELQKWIDRQGGQRVRNAVSFANLFPGIFLAQVVERANRVSVTYAVAQLEAEKGSTLDQAAIAHEEMQRRINISYERMAKPPLMRRLGGAMMFTAYPMGIISNNALALGSMLAGTRMGYTRAGAARALLVNFVAIATLAGAVPAVPWLVHQGIQAAMLLGSALFDDEEDEQDFLDHWKKYGRHAAMQRRLDDWIDSMPWDRGMWDTIFGVDMRTRLSVAESPLLAFSDASLADGKTGMEEMLFDALGPVVDTVSKNYDAVVKYADGQSTKGELFERIGPKWTRDLVRAHRRSDYGLKYGTEVRIPADEYSDMEIFMMGMGLSLTRDSNYYQARSADSAQQKIINKLNTKIKDAFFEKSVGDMPPTVADQLMNDLQKQLEYWAGERLSEKQLQDSTKRKLDKQEKLDANRGLTPTTKSDQFRKDQVIDFFNLREDAVKVPPVVYDRGN